LRITIKIEITLFSDSAVLSSEYIAIIVDPITEFYGSWIPRTIVRGTVSTAFADSVAIGVYWVALANSFINVAITIIVFTVGKLFRAGKNREIRVVTVRYG
jgi:hypothetical protein